MTKETLHLVISIREFLITVGVSPFAMRNTNMTFNLYHSAALHCSIFRRFYDV